MKQLVTVIVCWLACCTGYAQHDPLYSLYVNNPFALNPAYAGLNKALHAQVSYRLQWTGMAGNPRTLDFNGHSSILNNKGGIGVHVIQDKIGENKNTEVQAAFSYKIELDRSTLAFGMQAAAINFAGDPAMLNIRHPDDPNFFSYSKFVFNTGAGLLLRSDRYFIGLSAPRLLPATVEEGGTEVDVYSQSLYLTGAYIFYLSEKVSFKPAVLFRGMRNNPVSTDVQANFTFRNSYSAGLFTRNLNTYGLLAVFRSDKFQLGYVFEVPTNRSVGPQFLSHEVTLSIRTSVFRFHDLLRIENF
jgi:type IX secretion system PorP/SprF family membrane protein